MKFRIEAELKIFDKQANEENKNFKEFLENILDTNRKNIKLLKNDLHKKYKVEKDTIIKMIHEFKSAKDDLKIQKTNLSLLEHQIKEKSDDPDNNIKDIFESVNLKHNKYINNKAKVNRSMKTNTYKSNLQKDLITTDIGYISKSKINSKN